MFTTYGIILYLHSTLRFRINAQQRIIKVQDITKDFLGIKKNTLYLIKNVYTIENFLHGYKEFHSKLWRTDLVIGTDLLLFFWCFSSDSVKPLGAKNGLNGEAWFRTLSAQLYSFGIPYSQRKESINEESVCIYSSNFYDMSNLKTSSAVKMWFFLVSK